MNDLHTITILNLKSANEVIEKLLSATDTPGALIGRAKNGSAAIIFRSNQPYDTTPHILGAGYRDRTFNLSSKDGVARVRISTESVGRPDGYKWSRQVEDHELPVTTLTAADVGQRIIRAAFDDLGLTWTEIVDRDLAQEARLAQWKADLAAGKVRIESEDEKQAERDAELVKEHEGQEYSPLDGYTAQKVIGARTRHAARLAKVQAAADEIRQAEEDKVLLARVERGEFPHDVQRAIDARARQERRERQSAAA